MNNSNRAKQLAHAHYLFMKANIGLINDAKTDHYVTNPDYVLANNRQFIASSQMEAQPNGDATTEGQSLQILGYTYLYEGTKDQRYLNEAIKYFNAYIDQFYKEEIPDLPRRWACNWIVNGKEPVLANWPVDFNSPTHGGFQGPEWWAFINGRFQIPHGTPYWGQYLDKATFAFDGNLGWESIVATVYARHPDGKTDWDKPGGQYDVEWLINYEGDKINFDGDVLERGLALELYGTVQLKDDTINKPLRLCWGNNQPVEHGGYLLKRNEWWHNRPLRAPVDKANAANASDAEQWFLDAAWRLYELTGDKKYVRAFKAVEFTINEYAGIDQNDRYFRQSTSSGSPFSDGISYEWHYPDTAIPEFSRDSKGYINLKTLEASKQTIEQKSIWNKLDNTSTVHTKIGGACVDGSKLSAIITLSVSPTKEETNLEKWQISIPDISFEPFGYKLRPQSFVKEINPNTNNPYILADVGAVTSWGKTTYTQQFEDNVLDTRSATTITATLPDADSAFLIGAWLTTTEIFSLGSITLKSSHAVKISFNDVNKWTWHIIVNTANKWKTIVLDKTTFILNDWQNAHPDVPDTDRPSEFGGDMVEDYTINNHTAEVTLFSYYCINDIPITYSGDNFVILYNLVIAGDNAFTAKVGDCYTKTPSENLLYCTPGVIPFSNIYLPNQDTFDGWRGLPYPGYQYPFVHVHNSSPQRAEMMDNMCEFLWASQQWYFKKFNVMGPGASAYIWNRWDNLKYGPADTWTMNHWGDGHAWDGYQPRAYFGAARAWWELEKYNLPVPQKLKEYVNNWSGFLIDYMDKYSVTPTLFPADAPPPEVTDDFTGHMSGLFLAGACMAASCTEGKITGLDKYIQNNFNELNNNFVLLADKPDQIMNGSWTPAIREDSGDGSKSNGIFYGFWSGEILRALGLYIMYNNGQLQINEK